ncbi:MAG: VWA domain-containing protein [Bdellovibrionaceae bacterium]|nr:VWA domain-containing protein [Pseudobdellovibrionaceae bacterium]
MRRKASLLFINIFLLLLMVAFNNCGQPGEIRMAQLPSSSVGENDGLGTTPDPGAPVAPIVRPPVNPPTQSEPLLTKYEKTITLSETLKADILFVVDNSVSMEDEQSNMSARFPLFIKSLMQINWKVGVITTDVDDADYSFSDGQLQEIQNGVNYIDSKSTDAEASFSNVIQRRESGSPYEQGIYATYRFLERQKNSKTPFMRTDASLNVVFLTDADETPYEDKNGVTVVQKRNKPEELVKYLKSNWPMKKFQFHSIVVNEGDADCLSQSDNESYGIAYETLSKATNGVKGSVCAKDYGSQLQFMSEKIKDLVKTLTLDCAPAYDSVAKKYKFGIKHDGTEKVEVEKIEGNIVYFKGGLPTGNIKLEYICPSGMLSN